MKSKKSLVGVIIALIVVIAVAGAGYFGYSYVMKDINGDRGSSKSVTINYKSSGNATYEVGQALVKNGVINNDTIWSYWAGKNCPKLEVESGEYNLSSSMSYAEIAKKLEKPDVSHKEVSVTIPEGYSIYKIASTLEEKGICKEKDFLNAANSLDYDYNFVKTLEYDSNVAFQLDGFLFPATYDWCKNMKANEVVSAMLGAFADRYTEEMEAQCKKSGYSIREIVALASVVQKEALGKESMKNIASVFWNRINSPDYTMLQSDPTVAYAQLLKDNGYPNSIYDGYNTYKHKGIPVSAICNPGTQAISAALNPSKTDYYYFVTDKSNNFYYAKTWNEHVGNCQKAGIY